jgi:hypothetical protein
MTPTLSVSHLEDLTTRCLTFPVLSEPLIERENILSQMERWFLVDNVPLVTFDGDQGMGKTTLLAQFCLRRPKNSFSLFIGPEGAHSSSPEFLRQDLCSQLMWVFEQPSPSPEECSQALLSQLLGRLALNANGKGQHYFFVVDGFHNISKEEKGIAQSIINLLPWGSSRFFRFLLTGPEGQIPYPRQNNVRNSHVSLFTLPETQDFFHGVVGAEEARTIYRDFNGWPSKLSNVRRLLEEDPDPVRRLQELPKTDPGLFELEWKNADKEDEVTALLLAILAHESIDHNLRDLAAVASTDIAVAYQKLRPYTFLEKRWPASYPEDESNLEIMGQVKVDYVSASFRQFALGRLHKWKNEVEDRRISLLSQNLTDKTGSVNATSLVELTRLLEAPERANQLLSLLKPDSLAQILEGSHSLALTRQRAQAGIDAAVHTGRDSELHTLTIQKCTLSELEDASIGLSEIEANLALGNYDTALKLARNAVLFEDRLLQLATIAQAKHKRKLPIEEEITGQIKLLCEVIDAVTLGERAVDIASALLPTHPDLALSLVERANQTSGENALDWALARVSVSAIQKEARQEEIGRETPEALRERIKDPAVQRFTQMAGLLYSSGHYSAQEIVAQANALDKAGDQLFVLRQWALSNPLDANAAKVIDRGLEILAATRDYVPDTRDLRHLATPLPSVEASVGTPLLGLLRGLRETMLHRAVTEDDVVLRLLMAHAAWKWGEADARERFIEIYLDASGIPDLEIRATCLARLLSALAVADPEMKLESTTDSVHSLAQIELSLAVTQLLEQSSEHFLVFRGVLRPLARTHPALALEWIKQLNTGERRDMAYAEFVDSALRAPLDEIDFACIKEALSLCKDSALRSQTLLDGLNVLKIRVEGASNANNGQPAQSPPWNLSNALSFLSLATGIQDVDARCRAVCLAVVIVAQGDEKQNSYSSLLQKWLTNLQRDWSTIDSAWERIALGFEIVSALGQLPASTLLQETARTFLEMVETQRDTVSLAHDRPASAYTDSLGIAIRAVAGMAVTNQVTEAEKKRLASFIDWIPSAQERLALWTELALRAYRTTDFFRWACGGIASNLQDIKKSGQTPATERAIITAAPALYLFHQNTTVEELRALAPASRDAACDVICRFLLHKKPAGDPFQSKAVQAYPVTFPEAIDICMLLDMVESHPLIHLTLVKVVNAALDNKGEYAFSQENCQLLAQKIATLVQERIVQARNNPDTRQIKHQGYEIICAIEVLRLRARCKTAKKSDWDDLLSKTRALPNTADRAFILCHFANALQDSTQRRALFLEAKAIIDSIPATHDRLELSQFLIETAEVTESALATQLAKTAFQEALRDAQERDNSKTGGPPSHIYRRTRRFLDLMHGISPQVATTVAKEADSEPARQHLKARLKYLERKKKFENERHNASDIFECPIADWSRMAWSLLGQLNAGRLDPWRRSEARDFIRAAAQASLTEAMPILSWTIENLVRRHSHTSQARESLLPLFNAGLSGATIARLVAQRTNHHLRVLRTASFLQDDETGKGEHASISPQDRSEAFGFIDDWIRDNVKDELQICDGYLDVHDVCDLLRMVMRHQPDCLVSLLISEKALNVPVDEAKAAFLQRWGNLTSADPPNTHIIIASTGAYKKSPVHDRYFLTESRGLTTGTSANSYALSIHSMSDMDDQHFQIMKARLEPFISLRQRRQGTDNIRYTMVQLP